jgi:hypothetical protein
MVHDQVCLLKALQEKIWECDLLGKKKLNTTLTLMGSIPEGTRIGLANEIDVMMKFRNSEKRLPAFKVIEGDPFHLEATCSIPDWMENYIDVERKFVPHTFNEDLLKEIDSSLKSIFDEEKNPPRILIKTTNAKFNSDQLDCDKQDKDNDCDCRTRKEEEHAIIFKQCVKCVVAVSQTKVGVCLQFLWKDIDTDLKDPIYCSMDIIPSFGIEDMHPLELASIINTTMLRTKPAGWFTYLKKYVKADLILEELLQDHDGKTKKMNQVLLKNLNSSTETAYFIRPGQQLAVEKFRSEMHKHMYRKIKALKSMLSICEPHNYMLKKMLWKAVDPMLCSSRASKSHVFMRDWMQQPWLQDTFQAKINFDKWRHPHLITLKGFELMDRGEPERIRYEILRFQN